MDKATVSGAVDASSILAGSASHNAARFIPWQHFYFSSSLGCAFATATPNYAKIPSKSAGFEGRAITFKFKNRIFLWVFLLMFASGFLNASTLVLYARASSHHTGNLTQLAIQLSNGNTIEVMSLLGIILAFFLGGLVSGLIFFGYHMGYSRRFGTKLILDGLILFALHFITQDARVRTMVIAFILGSQNAFLTKYKGLTTRVSHVAGYLTDIAVFLARRIRGSRQDGPLFKFCAFQTLCFFLGALLGVLLIRINSGLHLFVPGAIFIFLGLFYLFLIRGKNVAKNKA